jgi:uncharacterized alpha-E superfamily protein
MLSSTAKNLYWMGRYLQRAKSTARLIEATQRMALQSRGEEAAGVAAIFGMEDEFRQTQQQSSGRLASLIDFLVIDENNPSSLVSSIGAARRNAREERNNITVDVWESLNGLWLELSERLRGNRALLDRNALIESVKKQAVMIFGAAQVTLLRDEAYNFLQLGAFLERADNTARILDVKYYVLLPHAELVGGEIDNVQWAAILRSVSAHRSYRWVYKDTYKPWQIADYLILNRQMPRSLRSCYEEIMQALVELGHFYAARDGPQVLAGDILRQLADGDMNAIFRSGLHEFLTEFIARNDRLGREISSTYHFTDKVVPC